MANDPFPNRVRTSVRIDAQPEPLTIDMSRTAVLVVDMQHDFGSKGGMFDRAGIDISMIQQAVEPTAAVVGAAREAGLPIIYLQMAFRPDLSDAGPSDAPNLLRHRLLGVGESVAAPDGSESRILIRDYWGTTILPELQPQPDDVVVTKTRFSGFYQTPLDAILQERKIKYLIVTGCTTSICVESTIRDAMFRDYSCLLLADCTGEPIGHGLSRSNHEASLLNIQTLIGWVSDSTAFRSALQARIEVNAVR